jgi:hypothetical protein
MGELIPEDIPVHHGVESKIFETFGNDEIIPSDIFQKTLRHFKFEHVKRGTSRSKELGAYVYQKPGGIYDTIECAQEFLAGAHELTKRGVLFPETKWGIYERPNGHFHVFAITRELQPMRSGPEEDWNRLNRPLYDELYIRAGILDRDDDQMQKNEKIKRELENQNSFVRYLDNGETGHANNWGYSDELRQFFPIDVEVIMFGGSKKMRASNRHAVEIETLEHRSILTGLVVPLEEQKITDI